MKYIKVGSLLVLCWQTFFDPENRKLDSLRGNFYSVTKYLEKRSFFPRRKEIIDLCRQACKLFVLVSRWQDSKIYRLENWKKSC